MTTTSLHCAVRVTTTPPTAEQQHIWAALTKRMGGTACHSDPRWLSVLGLAMRHQTFLLEAIRGEEVVGLLPLVLVSTRLFGRFLVSLPYVNTAGIVAVDEAASTALVDRAVQLADEHDVQYLELRHESEAAHPALSASTGAKIIMRLDLPAETGELWDRFNPKVRNQIRKGEKQDFTVSWGQHEQLADFYAVFCHNMRDLGTPVFSRQLFASILDQFKGQAELCTVKDGPRPVAAALLIHGAQLTEVPSASSLREYNPQNVNMLMYWHLLQRSIERGQSVFDFGRSSPESNTHRFKKQWGSQEHPAVWQHYVRHGSVGEMSRESPRYRRMIQTWQKLPVWLTQLIGPSIVRGIP